MKCKNCNTDLSSNFCSNCGQRSSVNKVTFAETFQDFVDATFSFNAPLIRTTKLLLINPGKLFNDYLNGKRKSYYKPVSFFIITTLIYVIIRSIIDYNPMTTAGVNVDGKILEDAGQFMVKNINNIMFLFVFTLAFFLKLLFYKRNSFAEFIAISFYAIGVYTLIGLVSMFFLKHIGQQYKSIPIFIFLFYVLFAFASFFNSKSFATIIKLLFAYFLSFLLYSGFGFLLSLLIVWLK